MSLHVAQVHRRTDTALVAGYPDHIPVAGPRRRIADWEVAGWLESFDATERMADLLMKNLARPA